MKKRFLTLLLLMASVCGAKEVTARTSPNEPVRDSQGAVVRFNTDRKVVYLIFSADDKFEGAPVILNTLAKHDSKGSFFLTGNCLRSDRHHAVIGEIIRQGHYVGAHSDKHLLYATWENRDSLIVSPDSLMRDFNRNMEELEQLGISRDSVNYYLPPYEWYNRKSVQLVEELGQVSINYTPGIRTAADYTTPDMKNYRSAQQLIDLLYEFEQKNGLNGAIILIHPGTEPARTDKLYNRLDEIITSLKAKGYSFERL